jgi:hypothetical protein
MENTLKKEVGVWIDSRRAVIVTIKNETSTIQEIRSNMDKQTRGSSTPHSKAKKDTKKSATEKMDSQQEQVGNPLGSYYEGVVSFIRGADSIWIFGPGEAKHELEKSLRRAELGDNLVGVATVGKMTDAQIAAKVHSRYYKY